MVKSFISDKNLRKFIKYSLAVYVFAGIVLFATAEWDTLPDFYMPYLMGLLALVSAFLIVLPQMVLRNRNTPEKEKVLIYFQAAIAFGLLINGAGGLGLYKLYLVGFPYDKLTHFVTPFVFTFAFTYLFKDWFSKSFKYSLISSAILVLIGGFLWEGLEYTSDAFLGTHLFGGGSSEVYADTIGDIIANFLGVFAAIAVLVKKRKSEK